MSIRKQRQGGIKMIYKKINGKQVTYTTMQPDPIFGITATLITKAGKGLLVDTQFSQNDADEIGKVIKAQHVELETIYVSYSDPDFYFGVARIKEAFPDAKVVATASTVKRIRKTYKGKLATWSEVLKAGAPKQIIMPNVVADSIQLDDQVFRIIGSDTIKQTLYSPEDNLLLGGILVFADSHIFMADTKTLASQQQWIADLDELIQLKPQVVIPGHFGARNTFSADNLSHTKAYLQKFMEVQQANRTSVEIVNQMTQAYPDLAIGNLVLGAKVVAGEQAWD